MPPIRTLLAAARPLLLPGAAEQDPGLLSQIQKQAHLSLRLIGGLELAVPALMWLAGLAVVPVPEDLENRYVPTLAVMAVGVATLAVPQTRGSRSRSRLLAALSIFLTSAVLAVSALALGSEVAWIDQYMLGYITLVMFGAVAAVPLRPLQMLALGISLDALHLATRLPAVGLGSGWAQHLFTLALALACTALTAVAYRNRVVNYHAQQRALQVSEELRQAQSRVLLSENAATTGRLAAALSHELNSPIGSLISAVETLASLAERLATAPPGERERIGGIAADVRQSARESTRRLREIVARMQRFTNLDKAEVQSANLNELLSDVAALLEPQARGRVEIQLDLAPLPAVHCRPQQLSAVFSNLLSNAIDSIEGGGRVAVSTRRGDQQIEARIQDTGRGMSPKELASIFDPGFRLAGGRVSTGNWSLFSTRQIVHEHGGDIRIASEEGKGTTVTVTLPV